MGFLDTWKAHFVSFVNPKLVYFNKPFFLATAIALVTLIFWITLTVNMFASGDTHLTVFGDDRAQRAFQLSNRACIERADGLDLEGGVMRAVICSTPEKFVTCNPAHSVEDGECSESEWLEPAWCSDVETSEEKATKEGVAIVSCNRAGQFAYTPYTLEWRISPPVLATLGSALAYTANIEAVVTVAIVLCLRAAGKIHFTRPGASLLGVAANFDDEKVNLSQEQDSQTVGRNFSSRPTTATE